MNETHSRFRASQRKAVRERDRRLAMLSRVMLLPCSLLAFPLLGPTAVADDFPEGCVSCHVVLGDGADKRLATVLDEIGHPPLKGKVAQVPSDCVACHEQKSEIRFSVLVHRAHYNSPATNVFTQRFGGDCRHCHTMDGADGEAGLKQGTPNW